MCCANVSFLAPINDQVGLFVVVLVGTRSSEYINTVLGNRWHTFSRQNYFDDRGVFMGVMWAAPLLILGFTMLVSETLPGYLRTSSLSRLSQSTIALMLDSTLIKSHACVQIVGSLYLYVAINS